MIWTRHDLGVVGSTSDEALALGRAGAPHGTVVVADGQTKGRGRQGHAWHSPPGENLYFSALLRLELAPAAAPPLTLAAGVAVTDALNSLGFRPSIKWPNDVLIEGRKVSGILTETSTRGERMELAVVGIGVNINTMEFPVELAAIATSLARVAGVPQDRERVLGAILEALGRWIDRFVADGAAPIVRAWRERSGMLGRAVKVNGITGTAVDVDDHGALLIDAGDRRVRVLSGEVED